jgi:hypothetical protein
MKVRCLIIALALLAAFASDSWGQLKQPSSQSKPSAQPSATDQRGTDQVPLAVKILPAADAKQQADKADQERKEKAIIDEKIAFETQRIADYTDRLARFTVLLFCIAVLQAGMFFWQLRYMNSGVKDARIAADASKETALATRDSVNLARDNAERQLRAYVFVDSAQVVNVIEGGGSPESHVVIKNFGQTPAYDVVNISGIAMDEYPSPPTLNLTMTDEDFGAEKPAMAMGPSDTSFSVIPSKRPPVPPEIRSAVINGTWVVYVYGEIRYKDVFGRKQWTKYRLMMGGPAGTSGGLLVGCDDGNQAS